MFPGAQRTASAPVHCWKCQIQADQHFLSLPRAKAVATVSWEALSLSAYRDHLSSSENPAQDRWVCPAAGTGAAHRAQSCLFPEDMAEGRQPCSAFLEKAQIIYTHPALSRHSSPECPRKHFSFLQKCHRETKLAQVAGRCRWSMGNNRRLAKPLECLNIPVSTGRTRQKLLPELTLFGS